MSVCHRSCQCVIGHVSVSNVTSNVMSVCYLSCQCVICHVSVLYIMSYVSMSYVMSVCPMSCQCVTCLVSVSHALSVCHMPCQCVICHVDLCHIVLLWKVVANCQLLICILDRTSLNKLFSLTMLSQRLNNFIIKYFHAFFVWIKEIVYYIFGDNYQ